MIQEAGAWYEYQLTGLSDALSFRASPAPGPSSKVSFVVYGDMGESDHARAKSPGYTPMALPLVLFFCSMCLTSLTSP